MVEESRGSIAPGASEQIDEWSNRTVVVTGAARGIGLGIVEALLETRANVVLSDVESDELATAVRNLDPSSERTSSFVADISDEQQVDRLVNHTFERFGGPHGWVNNAGRIELGPALDAPRSALANQLETNVVGLFQCCQAAARAMARRHEGGAIVNVASNAGKVGFPDMSGYNASKAAVISLTRSLAEEWAPLGINVNAVCPGSVQTVMLRRVAEYRAKRDGLDAEALLASFGPRQLKRAIEPIEVGRVVVFLLSNAATIIRGQSINVDGGDTPY